MRKDKIIQNKTSFWEENTCRKKSDLHRINSKRKEKNQRTRFWGQVTPNTRVLYYHGVPILAFPVCKSVNPIRHLINGQKTADKKSTGSHTQLHLDSHLARQPFRGPCIYSIVLLINFSSQAKEETTGKLTYQPWRNVTFSATIWQIIHLLKQGKF